jgi:DNA-binding transcriptional regulator GbsR (MarR family)
MQNTVNQLWFDLGNTAEVLESEPERLEYTEQVSSDENNESLTLEPEQDIITVKPDEYVNNRGRKYKPMASTANRTYKNPIDKSLLKDMLTDLDYSSKNVSAYARELNKVVDVIFNKHFSAYYTMKEDLEADAVLAVYNKRKYYNPNKDVWNFIYSIVRNEITNKLSKLNRILLVDDCVSMDRAVEHTDSYADEIPQKVLKWTDYMVGEVNFNYVKIPKKDILEVMVYLKIHERGQHPNCLPVFLKPTVENMNALYKLLKLIIG